uniref:Uncharacterized protein n=1 Tax=Vespula pensylvanica TaxID=30213 RepID=A0A834UE67_VESPE|nr:hypothetical protein H0235_002629 [Vespula pensylvanica]
MGRMVGGKKRKDKNGNYDIKGLRDKNTTRVRKKSRVVKRRTSREKEANEEGEEKEKEEEEEDEKEGSEEGDDDDEKEEKEEEEEEEQKEQKRGYRKRKKERLDRLRNEILIGSGATSPWVPYGKPVTKWNLPLVFPLQEAA